MSDIILKIEQTLDILVPVVLLVLGTLGLTNVVMDIEKWYPVVLEILGAAELIIKIWSMGIRRARNAKL